MFLRTTAVVVLSDCPAAGRRECCLVDFCEPCMAILLNIVARRHMNGMRRRNGLLVGGAREFFLFVFDLHMLAHAM